MATLPRGEARLTYKDALDYLYSFANYEHVVRPYTEVKLERMERLLELDGEPQRRFPSLLVAGTKGKGSTSAMLASIGRAAGLKTGHYSSPHLNTHRERYRIDGQPISGEDFARHMAELRERIIPAYDRPEYGKPTTFEISTLLAFRYFAEQAVDLAVVEVGLGGRLDATNTLEPRVSVIASISYDHMNVLGSTLTEIAGEKAGIIKPGKPVVSAPQRDEPLAVLRRVAAERGAPFHLATKPGAIGEPARVRAGRPLPERLWQEFLLPGTERVVRLPLLGEHQLANAATAIQAARLYGFEDDAIARGLETVDWPGRLDILRAQPLIVGDAAHNVDSMEKLRDAVRRHFAYGRLRLIAGFSADKDIPGMAAVINGFADEVVLTKANHPRAAEPGSIAEHFPGARLTASVAEALADLPAAGSDVMTLVTGSDFPVADARLHLGLVPPEDQDES